MSFICLGFPLNGIGLCWQSVSRSRHYQITERYYPRHPREPLFCWARVAGVAKTTISGDQLPRDHTLALKKSHLLRLPFWGVEVMVEVSRSSHLWRHQAPPPMVV
ncbi:hypothetical protein BKA70DRAFT_1430033 [Coprinopsis sp. MPI-PUGE-AT-0042]|nr:hypothetical protein BKA70DRAFT_1430033 [Coprinopsis sp. MPI-PUGE-AT-0042]